MKKYAKRLKEYDEIEFDPAEIIEGIMRLESQKIMWTASAQST